MCGIVGYRVVKGSAEALDAALPDAVRTLHYRGPDDHGVWFDGQHRVGLGHRRLSILDLSAHGHQPMASSCGNWHMVFNGEVYNFREIRQQLEQHGHQFAGTGDSEVILAAFSQWGPNAVARFVGMFAIALWHRTARRLYLLRDRLGVKPLYYRWDDKSLLFGSELKALRALPGWEAELDPEGLNDYLRYAYISDPRTVYKQVFKLPPAHYLALDEGGNVELQRYWSAIDHMGRRHGRSEAELEEELETLMISAFKYRMIADVPVGVFLSGGVDSSVLTAILQKHGGQQVKTFTIGFDKPEYDESPYAAEVARVLGTDHHSRMLKVEDAKAVLPIWGDLYDEPFGDESGIPTFMVSKVASEQVKVVLSADGGDELFSGYNSYTSVLHQWDRIKDFPQGLRSLAAATINGIGAPRMDAWFAARSAAGVGQLAAPLFSKLAKIGAGVGARGVGEVFDRGNRHFAGHELAGLVGMDVSTRVLADRYPGVAGEKLCLWDLHHYMPGDILTKVDRATMAVSIEGREPLIDHRLVEFAFSLPFEMRRGTLGAKHLLKKILYRYVPRSIVERPKRGFGIPVKEWLATDLRGLVDDHLEHGRITAQGIFDPAMVQGYIKRLREGDASVRQRVWLLVAFQMWHRRWMSAS